MPNPDNSNKSVTAFFKGFRDKCKYLLASKSAVELYDLYIDGEFLRVIDEDFFTLLRIPEAINTGDSLNHYDSNAINNWIAHHPYFVVPFLACAGIVGVARVVQALASAPAYPKTISEFLNLIRQDSEQTVTDESPNLINDQQLLNDICIELKIPYEYQIFTIKKRRKKKTGDKQPLLEDKTDQSPSTNTTDEDQEERVAQQVLMLCKKDEPTKVIPEHIATKTQPNWFERTYQKVSNSKFVQFVLTPPWNALNRAAYTYWILWFGAVITSAIITGSLVLTATGTVAVTTAALAIVIGIPTAVFFSFYGVELIDKIWPKNKSNKETELDEVMRPKIVDNKSEQENVFSLIGKALALRFHTSRQKTVLDKTLKRQQRSLKNDSVETESTNDEKALPALSSDSVNIVQSRSTPLLLSDESDPNTLENSAQKYIAPSKKYFTWRSLTKFCEGYVRSTFCVWFATSVITSFAIKFGAMAIVGALSATVIGIPVSLLISFSVGMTVGGLFAVSGGAELSLAEKEKQAYLAAHPELQPVAIKKRESQWKLMKQKLKTLEQQHDELVDKNNYLISQLRKLPSNVQNDDANSSNITGSISEPLPIYRKNNYHELKQNHIAYNDANKSTFSKSIDYISTAIGNAGRMGYITRSLMIGGMITILAFSFAHPLGFITGPAAIATAVAVSGALFGAATVLDKYYQQQKQKEEINHLKLRSFEITEKEKLQQDIENQCIVIENQNQKLSAQIKANEAVYNKNYSVNFASQWEKYKTTSNWDNVQNFFKAKQTLKSTQETIIRTPQPIPELRIAAHG